MTQLFKRCTLCGREWITREEFLSDETNRLEGYQGEKRRIISGLPAEGLLLFTHQVQGCGTTMAIAASRFKETVNGR